MDRDEVWDNLDNEKQLGNREMSGQEYTGKNPLRRLHENFCSSTLEEEIHDGVKVQSLLQLRGLKKAIA